MQSIGPQTKLLIRTYTKQRQTCRLGPKTSPIVSDSLVVIVVVVVAAVMVVAIVVAVVRVGVVVVVVVVAVVAVVVVVQPCVTFRDHHVTGT